MLSEPFWDVYARLYNRLGVLAPYQELLRNLSDRLRPMVTTGTRILDVGCGTGRLLAFLKQEYPHCVFVGVDRSPQMLAVARRQCGQGVRLIQHDVDAGLPFPKARRFDCILSVHMLYATASPESLLREMYAALPAGGVLLLVNPHTAEQWRVWAAHFQSLMAAKSWVEWWMTIKNIPPFAMIFLLNAKIAQRSHTELFFWNPDELRGALEYAGFTILEEDYSVYGGTSSLFVATR